MSPIGRPEPRFNLGGKDRKRAVGARWLRALPATATALRDGQGANHASGAMTGNRAVKGIRSGRSIDGDRRRLTRLQIAGMDIQLIDAEVVGGGPVVDK